MKTRILVILSASILLMFIACKQETSTETTTTGSTTTAATETMATSTTATDTSATTSTTTTTTTTTATDTAATAPATTSTTTTTKSSATDKIKEGAKQIGQGVKQGSKDLAVATGTAMQKGGEKLEEVGRKPSTPAPAPVATPTPAPVPTPSPATPAPKTASASAGSASAGASLFKSKCVACHGADASGNTPMGKKNNIPDLRTAKSMSDAQLTNLIENGKPGGFSATAHKGKVAPDQVRDVIAYIRSL